MFEQAAGRGTKADDDNFYCKADFMSPNVGSASALPRDKAPRPCLCLFCTAVIYVERGGGDGGGRGRGSAPSNIPTTPASYEYKRTGGEKRSQEFVPLHHPSNQTQQKPLFFFFFIELMAP